MIILFLTTPRYPLERQGEDKINPEIVTQNFKEWESNDFMYNLLNMNNL